MSFWRGRKVLVTGGASFIGSHLVETLAAIGARVRVVDDLSSGRLANIAPLLASNRVVFEQGDLRDPGVARRAVMDTDTIFHLAADQGGRGYLTRNEASTASNLCLDGVVFREAVRAGVRKVVYASSVCVYPPHVDVLTEEMVGPPYAADRIYGWSKLMGEMTLRAYCEHGLQSVACRYSSVYGPRGRENHAVIAMIARAFVKQDPFEVWGDGTQVRNWTYVDDIVAGTILAGEKIGDGSAVNLGTHERIRVIDAANLIMDFTGHHAEVKLLRDMPTGPLTRVASSELAAATLGWAPTVAFRDGLKRTIEWYYADRNREDVRARLSAMLVERR